MIDKVEAGKKYRLIDKQSYVNNSRNRSYNNSIIEQGYIDADQCVIIDEVDNGIWGMSSGQYVISPNEYHMFELVEENDEVQKPKVITPETPVTITTTYGELAQVYYVLGKVNGKTNGRCMWKAVAGLLGDSNHSIYWKNEPNHPLINYLQIQEKWESLFFKSKEQQEKEIAIKQKRDMIAELEKEIKELGGE